MNRSKIYGSTSNITILQKNLGSTGFSVAPTPSIHNNNNNYTTNKQSNNKNVNMTTVSVDNWLNAWDNPELQQEQQKLAQQQQQQSQQRHQFKEPPPVAAKKPSFDYNSNKAAATNSYQFRNNFDNTKPITLPLKPIQIHNKNVQRTGKFNDPWAGDFTFIFYIFLHLFCTLVKILGKSFIFKAHSVY